MTLRRTVQILLFVLFVYLITQAVYPLSFYTPVTLFLLMDPLSFLGTALAGRLSTFIIYALPGIVAALLLGRFFCGWVCPMGTLIDFSDFLLTPKSLRRNDPNTGIPKRQTFLHTLRPRTKYLLLVVFTVSAILGVQWFWFLDPIPTVTRLTVTTIIPYSEWLTRSFFNALFHVRGVRNFSEPVYSWLKAHILTFEQPYSQGHWVGAFMFLAIALLSLLGRRTWCRSLCPLGALLSLLSSVSPTRLHCSEACSGCKKCASLCKTGALVATSSPVRDSYRPKADLKECILCGVCWQVCPEDALSVRWDRPEPERIDLNRRQVLGAMAAGVISAPLAALPTRDKGQLTVQAIRPPGALEEREFLDVCVRCGECMRVCPQNGLHPSLGRSGIEGLFTPELIPRLGYCAYECVLCGQVCPTGAIEKLIETAKKRLAIGLAQFVKDRCIPFAQGVDCLVCEEHCPTPAKAIEFRKRTVEHPHRNKTLEVKEPYVIVERCIGCGICEKVCPLDGAPGVRVYPYAKQKVLPKEDSTKKTETSPDPYGGK